MAIRYDVIFKKIWLDRDFLKLPAEAKLVFFALRTAPECNAACIFSLYPEVLARRTGYPLDTIMKGIRILSEGHWIYYQEDIFWIKNGLKYQANINLKNENHRKMITKILEDLPNCEIVEKFCKYYGFECHRDTLRDTLTDTIEIPSEGRSDTIPNPVTVTITETISNNYNNKSIAPTDEKSSGRSRPLPATKRIKFDYELEEFEGITEDDIKKWNETYPAIDIRQEIRKAGLWLVANPTKRKKNIYRFLINWFSRAKPNNDMLEDDEDLRKMEQYRKLNEIGKKMLEKGVI